MRSDRRRRVDAESGSGAPVWRRRFPWPGMLGTASCGVELSAQRRSAPTPSTSRRSSSSSRVMDAPEPARAHTIAASARTRSALPPPIDSMSARRMASCSGRPVVHERQVGSGVVVQQKLFDLAALQHVDRCSPSPGPPRADAPARPRTARVSPRGASGLVPRAPRRPPCRGSCGRCRRPDRRS